MTRINHTKYNRNFRNTVRATVWLSFTLLLTVSGAAKAQVVPTASAATSLLSPLTLDQAVSIALKQNPQEYIARTQQTQAAGQKTIAQSQYLPTVTPSYQYQRVTQNRYGSGTSYIVSNGGTGTQTISSSSSVNGGTGGLSISQTLFDNGAREVANAQARRGADIANYNMADVRQQIVLAVTQDYYNLLRQVDQVKVAQADVDRYNQTVALTEAQAKAGTAAQKDVLQAQANLASAQITLLQDQNLIKTASASLKNSMGVESNAVVQPVALATGTSSDLAAPPESGAEKTLDQYVEEAYDSRPDLKEQQAAVSSQDLSVKSARLNAGLQVNGTYNYTYTPFNDIGARGTGSSLYATFSYPLFDGGSSRATVRVAQAQRDAVKDQLEQDRQNVRLGVETYFTQRSEALQRTHLAQIAIQAAQTNYDAAVASRKAGVATILDVTTAQATLTTTQNQYVGAVYDFYIADANLKRATGTITE